MAKISAQFFNGNEKQECLKTKHIYWARTRPFSCTESNQFIAHFLFVNKF